MAEQKRRNIVMIMCDQMRPDFLHAYGADFIPTPNLDALAADGAVFDNAITPSTVCGPARASIVTGRAVSDHDGWTNEIPPRAGVEFFPERLSADGYMTVAVGNYDHAPFGTSIGYQYLRRMDEDHMDSEYMQKLQKKYPDCTSWRMHPEGDPYHYLYPEEDHYERWACDCATEFLDSYAQSGTVADRDHDTVTPLAEAGSPFFLYCGFLAPHAPYLPPQEMSGRVDPEKLPEILVSHRDEDLPSVERYRRAYLNSHETLVNPESAAEVRKKERLAYCEMICYVDELVGRIVQSLKKNGLYENTTVVFMSDHGSMENDLNMSTKGPWPYSPQLFVPLIVSNHPNLRGHQDFLCGTIDIGATLLDIAGDKKAFGLSRSLIAMANGTAAHRNSIMSEFCDSCKTVIDHRYTFTYYPFTGVCALYDRINDPQMLHDLGRDEKYTDVRNRFLMEVIDWTILSRPVRIEAHDMTPEVLRGIEEKHPKFLETFEIAYPLANWESVDRLEQAGLDPNINEFCKEYPIKADYGVYFRRPRKK